VLWCTSTGAYRCGRLWWGGDHLNLWCQLRLPWEGGLGTKIWQISMAELRKAFQVPVSVEALRWWSGCGGGAKGKGDAKIQQKGTRAQRAKGYQEWICIRNDSSCFCFAVKWGLQRSERDTGSLGRCHGCTPFHFQSVQSTRMTSHNACWDWKLESGSVIFFFFPNRQTPSFTQPVFWLTDCSNYPGLPHFLHINFNSKGNTNYTN
jgi:hypothetical protein